jgi:DNA polymerase-3 subunit beta
MQFTIGRAALQKELGFVQGVVERKNMIPVLANLLIESMGSDSIRISGTDLDVTIRADVAADSIQAEGAICVQARKLFDIARLLPDGPVTFTKQENEWVTVESGQAKFKLPGIAKDTFPDLPAPKATPFAIPSSLLKRLIQQTIFAITTEEGRYTLSGAKFELSKNETKVITTDGHRLALVSTKQAVKQSGDETLELLIPRKTLAELTKLAADFNGDIDMGADDDSNHIYFQVGTRTLVSRLLAGQFPNYEMVLPKDNDQSATFNTSDLSKAIRRVALMADDSSHSIRLTLGKEQLLITSQSPEEGEAREIVSTDFAGDEIDIGFNASYLQDFLNAAGTERIVFEFKDANSQAQLRPVTDNDEVQFLCVVMPMRI